MPHDDPIHDTKSAGIALGGEGSPLSPRTLERWRLEGIGPEFIKVGKSIRYRQSALAAYRDAHTFRSTAEAQAPRRAHPADERGAE